MTIILVQGKAGKGAEPPNNHREREREREEGEERQQCVLCVFRADEWKLRTSPSKSKCHSEQGTAGGSFGQRHTQEMQTHAGTHGPHLNCT